MKISVSRKRTELIIVDAMMEYSYIMQPRIFEETLFPLESTTEIFSYPPSSPYMASNLENHSFFQSEKQQNHSFDFLQL